MRKNRTYKRTGQYRDDRLFLIICEGNKTEKLYFNELNERLHRLKIITASPEDNRSSPMHVLDLAEQYKNKYDLEADDQIWLVMDTDRWGDKKLSQVYKTAKKKGFNLAISNPCFETWLHLHFADIPKELDTCKKLKPTLDKLLRSHAVKKSKGIHFIPYMAEALERAKALDNPNEVWPSKIGTKVHLLMEELWPMFHLNRK